MKIVKLKKKKNNKYEITFDNNEKIDLFDDVILKYELLLKSDIEKKDLIKIINDNNINEAYLVAIKYISIKFRSEKEIIKKLKDYDKKTIDIIIERLKKEGYLNDSNYIKAYINDEISFKLNGPNKIKYDLKNMGLNESLIINYLNTIDNNIWLDKINKYIQKKIKTNHNLSPLFLKNKIINDLINKGFYKEDIIRIIDNYEFKLDNELYEKEYNKQKVKLQKKYSGEELEYRIKINLIKKGFKKDLDY